MNRAAAGRPFRAVAVSDMYDPGAGAQAAPGKLMGAKLVAGAAAATAQLTDSDGTILADFSAPANGADWLDVPVWFRGKLRLNVLTGAGAIVNTWIE